MAIAVAPLVHIGFPRQNAKVESYSKELDRSIQIFDDELILLRAQYDNKEISAETFISLTDSVKEKRASQEKVNEKLYDEKVEQERVFGWKTWRVFLIGFGIRIVYLFFSIIITLLTVFFIKPEKGKLKNSLITLQVFCYSISFYVLIWVFWPSQDYPIETYWVAMSLGSVILSIALVSFLMWYRFKIERLQDIAKNLIRFTYNIETVGRYIIPEKRKKYKRERTELVNQSLDNE